jgi:hypothetical protein
MVTAAQDSPVVVGGPVESVALQPAHQADGSVVLIDGCAHMNSQAANTWGSEGARNISTSPHAAVEGGNTFDGSPGCCPGHHCISSSAFGVLAGMMNSILEAAAYQEDYRVVLAVLEISCLVFCKSCRSPITSNVTQPAGIRSITKEGRPLQWQATGSTMPVPLLFAATSIAQVTDFTTFCIVEPADRSICPSIPLTDQKVDCFA